MQKKHIPKGFIMITLHKYFQASSSRYGSDEADLNQTASMRSSAGLGEFQRSEGTLSPGELQLGKSKEDKVDDFESVFLVM